MFIIVSFCEAWKQDNKLGHTKHLDMTRAGLPCFLILPSLKWSRETVYDRTLKNETRNHKRIMHAL